MNHKSIDHADNADLRGSLRALQRAAQRARELARQTGTDLIVSRNGIIERIKPQQTSAQPQVRDSAAPYGDKS